MKVFGLNLVLLMALLVMVGCAPTRFIPKEGDSSFWNKIPDAEKHYYQNERLQKSGIPSRGLTLSGGGQRAASVGLGFLEALERKDELKTIDVISSVSGGSYAAYWWFSKNFWSHDRRSNDLPCDKYKFFRRYGYVLNNDSTDKDKPEEWLCKQRKNFEQPKNCDYKLEENEIKLIDSGGIEFCRADNPLVTWNDFPYFHHLNNHGYLVTWSQEHDFAIWGEYFAKFVALFPPMPMNWIFNGLFDMKVNVNPIQDYYRDGIERDYGLFPKFPIKDEDEDKVLKNYVNNSDWLIFDRIGANDPSDQDLFASMTTHHMPFWIINATAAYGTKAVPKMLRNGGEWTGYSKDLQHTVYEFTPISQGSPWWGYCGINGFPCKENIKLSRKVAISGAAIDSLTEFFNSVIDIFNFSLGQYIDNPYASDSDRIIHRLLPNPLVQLHHSAHDEKAPFIYLSDGGHSDNLGLYSLVRRGVKEIIVVDAGQESNAGPKFYSRFEDLQTARFHLWKEHHVLIDIPELFGDNTVSDQAKAIETLHFDYKHAKDSIFHGQICVAERWQTHCKEGDPANQELWYVKLSIDNTEIENAYSKEKLFKNDKGCKGSGKPDTTTKYSCTTLLYASSHIDSHYPHEKTYDINFSSEQVAGYIALGNDLGNQFLEKFKNNTH